MTCEEMCRWNEQILLSPYIKMKIIVSFCIFCVVLFVYLHVQFHLKTGEDLELYEIDAPSKERLEELCDLRQPVIFDFDGGQLMQTNLTTLAHMYPAFELKVRNVRDTDPSSYLYAPLPLHETISLFREDKGAQYFTENNAEFLKETGVAKQFQYNDEFLRPYMVSNCNYDVMAGSDGTRTPFRYEVNYRNYMMLTHGSAQIKLAPPHSAKYLHPLCDYEDFEFRSPVDPWAPQPRYKHDFDKVKCLEFTLMPGKTLYVPAYWWYSIQFGKGACLSCFRYRTYMNNVAISPYIFLHALQLQNVKHRVVRSDMSQLMDNTNKSSAEHNVPEEQKIVPPPIPDEVEAGASFLPA